MTESVHKEHLVPTDTQTLEESVFECEFSVDKPVISHSPLSSGRQQQFENGEAVVLAMVQSGTIHRQGSEKCDSSGGVTECYSDSPPHEPHEAEADLPPSSGGSQVTDGGSSCDSGELPEAFHQPAESVGGNMSPPDNEVVCGIGSFPCLTPHSEANLPLNQVHPEPQESTPFGTTSLVLSMPAWPPQLPEMAQNPADYAADPTMDMNNGQNYTQSIAEVESLTVQDNIQQIDQRRGSLVTGVTPCSENQESSFNFQDIISDQHHFLEKSIDTIGEVLNPLVSAEHHSPRSEVKFRTPKKVYENKRRRTTVTEDTPVLDPANNQLCPEAFDGRQVLKHMCTYYRHYADTLNYGCSSEFKMLIKQIVGRIPKRRNPSLTWDVLFNTLFYMRSFIEVVVEGLEDTDKLALADCTRAGINKLNDITENANRAREILTK